MEDNVRTSCKAYLAASSAHKNQLILGKPAHKDRDVYICLVKMSCQETMSGRANLNRAAKVLHT